MKMHPMHKAFARELRSRLTNSVEVYLDPACGGTQQLPLFIGKCKSFETRMCCVDLLVLKAGKVRAIIEIEESGFLPTKVCGKFFQAALADHYIPNAKTSGSIPYSPKVLFIQVLDGSSLKPNSRKKAQAALIERQIKGMLPLRGITDYRLLYVSGAKDKAGLKALGQTLASWL